MQADALYLYPLITGILQSTKRSCRALVVPVVCMPYHRYVISNAAAHE